MSEENLNKVAKEIADLLNVLKIERVVHVDDQNIDGINLEDILAAATESNLETIQAALVPLDLNLPDEIEVWGRKLRDVWEIFSEAEKQAVGTLVLATAREFEGGELVDDKADSAILAQIIPSGMLVSLSPNQWPDRKVQLLREANSKPTLFLFDQNLGLGKEKGGMDIIASLLAFESDSRPYCGLLTHTVKPESQIAQWEELCKDYNLSPDEFIVIPKEHLSSGPEQICYSLKLVVLTPHFGKLKKIASEILEASVKVAAERIQSVNIFDLEHMIFRAGLTEGNWEPDVLFRLHSLFQRNAARDLARSMPDLEIHASRLRSASAVMVGENIDVIKRSWEIQKEEMYENADYINGNLLPLELGDIFKKRNGTKLYVLIAQPCDLMLRANGKRQPDLEYVVLAELNEGAPTDGYDDLLPCYGESPGTKWHVSLNRTHTVKVSILDLCCFNINGTSAISLADAPPAAARPSLKGRFLKIQTVLNKILAKIAPHRPKATDVRELLLAKNQMCKLFEANLFSDSVFSGNRSESNVVTFNCDRVGRVSSERAFGLLMSYTSCVGRPAYPSPLVNARSVGAES
jgi:hypothetical protein